MGRKSNEQKRKEEFERLTGAIEYNEKDIQKDIDEYSWRVAELGYKEAKAVVDLKDAMSMLEISNKRLKELKTVKPTEESFGKWFDDNFLNWKRKEIKNIESILNLDIIINFLYIYLADKFDSFKAINKINQIKEILGIESKG